MSEKKPITLEELQAEAAKFLAAGKAYWDLMQRAPRMGGAISWVKDTEGGMVIFTRGEYSEQLLRNIENCGPVTHFGSGAVSD